MILFWMDKVMDDKNNETGRWELAFGLATWDTDLHRETE